MKKLSILLTAIFALFLLVNTSNVFAVDPPYGPSVQCNPNDNNVAGNHGCKADLFCKVTSKADPNTGTCQPPQINIDTPEKGFATLGNAISNIITIAFAVAVLIVLVMLIWGAFEWIVSGGDKEAVGKARGRIINALIGLAVLAIAFALARVAGQFTGLDLNNLVIPSPDPSAKGL